VVIRWMLTPAIDVGVAPTALWERRQIAVHRGGVPAKFETTRACGTGKSIFWYFLWPRAGPIIPGGAKAKTIEPKCSFSGAQPVVIRTDFDLE